MDAFRTPGLDNIPPALSARFAAHRTPLADRTFLAPRSRSGLGLSASTSGPRRHWIPIVLFAALVAPSSADTKERIRPEEAAVRAMSSLHLEGDPEIGANDFRISDMGGTGDPGYDAWEPAVAYNATDNEYLVVWEGDDDVDGLVDNEYEIFGQRLDATTGAEVGSNDFRISDMGGTGDVTYGALLPAVAYNATDNEYLVVWRGDDNAGGLVNGETEIFGQRLDGATGAEVGSNDFRISDMGGTGDANYNVYSAAVAYNAADNEYLVVWTGDDNVGGLVDNESEAFGQRLDAATGAEVGSNDFRISDLGGTGNVDYGAQEPR